MYKNIIDIYLDTNFFYPYYDFDSDIIEYNINDYIWLVKLSKENGHSVVFYNFVNLIAKTQLINHKTYTPIIGGLIKRITRLNRKYKAIKLKYNNSIYIYKTDYKKKMSKYKEIINSVVGVTLYKITANDRKQIWKITSIEELDDKTALWKYEYGKYKGAMIKTIKDVNKYGRLHNSCYEQAIANAKSAFDKKIKNGYCCDINKIMEIKKNNDRPMLALSYHVKIVRNSIKYPCVSQPKIDGVFVQIKMNKQNQIVYLSRTNKKFKTLEYLNRDFKLIFNWVEKWLYKNNNNINKKNIKKYSTKYRFCGEFYDHDIDRPTISGYINRDEPCDEIKKITFYIFESYVFQNNYTYKKRRDFLNKMNDEIGKNFKNIKILRGKLAKDQKELDKLFKKYNDLDYEGQMIRNLDGHYENDKRSKNLIKRKQWQDDIGKIIKITLVSKDNENIFGITLTLKSKRFPNKEIVVNGDGTEEYRRKIYENRKKYIGKKLRYEYLDVQMGLPINCKPFSRKNKYEFQN